MQLWVFLPTGRYLSLPVMSDSCVAVSYQVMECDLRKKVGHAQEVYDQVKHTLTYYSFQKQRLEDLISQMTERLEMVEGCLSGLTEASSPEDMSRVKVTSQCSNTC